MQPAAVPYYSTTFTAQSTVSTTNWNTLAVIFDTKSNEAVDPRAADNILIAWPQMLDMLEGLPSATAKAQILDFGCGTGAFARKLKSLGHDVQGIDPAQEMITIAKRQSADIPFAIGSVDQISQHLRFDAITAIMVFQFIDDKSIHDLFSKLTQHLKPNARLVFAVHNSDYLAYAQKKPLKYYETKSGQFYIRFKEHGSIQLYPRSPEDYSRILEPLGMKKLAESTPAFTDEYIAKYGSSSNEPVDRPKFLIMSFVKI